MHIVPLNFLVFSGPYFLGFQAIKLLYFARHVTLERHSASTQQLCFTGERMDYSRDATHGIPRTRC